MRRVEGAAEQADAHARACGGRTGTPRPAGRGPCVARLRPVLRHGRVWPVPRTRYLKEVSCSTPDRAAGMHPAGGDADLRAEAELAAVGELGRGVVQHDAPNRPRSKKRSAAAASSVTMPRCGASRMRSMWAMRLVDAVDHAHGDDGVEIFGAPVVLGRGSDARVDSAARRRRRARRSRRRAAPRGAARGGWPRARGRPAASRPRRRRRCGASWR